MLIKKEFFENEDGAKMVREYYGESEDNITALVEASAEEGIDASDDPSGADTEPDAAPNEVNQDEFFAQILLNQAELLALLKSGTGGNSNV